MRRFIDIVAPTEQFLTEGRKDEYAAMFAGLVKEARLQDARMHAKYSAMDLDKTLGNDKELRDVVERRMNNEQEKKLLAFFNQKLAWAQEKLKRHDRIMWYLKLVRIDYSIDDTYLKDLGRKYRDEYERSTGEHFSWGTHRAEEMLVHFLSLPIAGIQRYPFGGQGCQKVYNDLREMEQEWQEKRKGTILPKAEDEVLLDCGDGWVWFHLPRAYCRDEADAMGHCGNQPRKDSGDAILSLRKKTDVMGSALWKPYATFILTSEGHLTEMKGRFNEKPGHHEDDETKALIQDHIAMLLHHPSIKRLVGGGHRPEANFHLFDLDDEKQAEVLSARPELGLAVQYAIHKGRDDTFAQMVEDELSNELGYRHTGSVECTPQDTIVKVFSNAQENAITKCVVRVTSDFSGMNSENSEALGALCNFADEDFADMEHIEKKQGRWKGTGMFELVDHFENNDDFAGPIHEKWDDVPSFVADNEKLLNDVLTKVRAKITEQAKTYLRKWLEVPSFHVPLRFNELEDGSIQVLVDTLFLAKGLYQYAKLNHDDEYEVDVEGAVITDISEYGWYGVSDPNPDYEYMGARKGVLPAAHVLVGIREAVDAILLKTVERLCR